MQEPADAALGHRLIFILKHAACHAGGSVHRLLANLARSCRTVLLRPIRRCMAVTSHGYFHRDPNIEKRNLCDRLECLCFGVTLPSQASEVVGAVSDLLLAGRLALPFSHFARLANQGLSAAITLLAQALHRGAKVPCCHRVLMHLEAGHHRHRHFNLSAFAACKLRIESTVCSLVVRRPCQYCV